MYKEIKKNIPQLPEPPSYLLTQELNHLVNEVIQKKNTTAEVQKQKFEDFEGKTVDSHLYQSALEERRLAELRSAEIYCKYLELLNYGEKMVKRVRALERFRTRMRPLYDRATEGDALLIENLNLARQDLDNARDLINSLNIKNQTLEVAIQNHQESFLEVSKQVAQAESAMNYANEQFQLLSQDYEVRGKKILELEKSILKKEGAILDLTEKLKALRKKADQLLDENMLTSNQLRQSQIHASGIETLNDELTQSIPKLQRQIHTLEEKLRIEKETAIQRTAAMSEELERLREERHIVGLVEKAKTSGQPQTESKLPEVQNPKQWNEFTKRWSGIIDELSSLSAPMRQESEIGQESVPMLASEIGDLEIK